MEQLIHKSSNGTRASDPVWAGSPGIWAMMQPARAYEWLAGLPEKKRRWIAVRKPLLVAFFLGCVVSLLATDRLTLRIAGPATIYACFVPLAEIAALFLTRPKNRMLSFSRTVDLFFTGHGPWLLWLVGFAALWTFTSPIRFFASAGLQWSFYLAGLVAVWCGYIDLCFFRKVYEETRGKAVLRLFLHRAVSWTLGFVIFGGGSLWPEIVRILRI